MRVLKRATVIYISDMDAESIKKMHMIPASSIANAIKIAKEILGICNPTITAIPDGVSVIIEK